MYVKLQLRVGISTPEKQCLGNKHLLSGIRKTKKI